MNHIRGAVLLDNFAIQPGFKQEILRISNIITGHQPRTEATRLAPVFTGGELGMLPVAYRTVHVAGVAGNIVRRFCFRDIKTGLPDDNDKLTLVI